MDSIFRFKKGDRAVCLYNTIGSTLSLNIGEVYDVVNVSNSGMIDLIDIKGDKFTVFGWCLDTISNYRNGVIDNILE